MCAAPATTSVPGRTPSCSQLTAEFLSLELDQVRVGLGDSAMPWAPPAGGSGLTGALGNAVHAACQAFLTAVR